MQLPLCQLQMQLPLCQLPMQLPLCQLLMHLQLLVQLRHLLREIAAATPPLCRFTCASLDLMLFHLPMPLSLLFWLLLSR